MTTSALLGPGLDLKLRNALARQTFSERQTLIQRAAELYHNNHDKLAGLAEAYASAAEELVSPRKRTP